MKKLRTRGQWQAILLLGIFLAATIGVMHWLNRKDETAEHIKYLRMHARERSDSLEIARHHRDSMRIVWKQEKAEREARRATWEKEKKQREKEVAAISIFMHPFDPNTADSAEFVQLGLQPWMAKGLVRYRAKGAIFRKADDLKKLNWMTDSLFASLSPYICIADSFAQPAVMPTYVSRKRDTILCLNTADTATLQMIRGIGRYSAVQIVRYRERLGGYVSVQQLREIDRLRDVDSLIPHFTTDTSLVRKLYVNRLSTEALNRHPYLSFEQARAIHDEHHRHGKIRDASRLLNLKFRGEMLFTEEDIERLRPYLSFE